MRGDTGLAAAFRAAIFLGTSLSLFEERREDASECDEQADDEEAEALVYSIIVVPIESSAGRELGGEHALIQLSEDTGGKYYYATSAAQLDDAFRQISDELRTQYLLAYYPSQHLSNSQFRRIHVGVTGPAEAAAYHVRTRAGYYTGKSDF